ncbi:zinc ribbon domain-containing protein [Zarconia navalis]|uniref:zinc ribbon domain-containing protein n=1 Tax=Zarconia navalis TaxID=2992134 RepID=UPI003F926DC8
MQGRLYKRPSAYRYSHFTFYWFPSSKRCSNCGHVVEKLPLDIRQWKCPSCGQAHDRDVNASINILAAGLAVSVCGATVRPEQSKSVRAGALKQKPRIVR